MHIYLNAQAVFMQTVEIFCKRTRARKIEIKGGFYSREDMRKELGYSELLDSTYSHAGLFAPTLVCDLQASLYTLKP